jgi:hypothetical protein
VSCTDRDSWQLGVAWCQSVTTALQASQASIMYLVVSCQPGQLVQHPRLVLDAGGMRVAVRDAVADVPARCK